MMKQKKRVSSALDQATGGELNSNLLSRRKLLAGVSSALIASIAGCGEQSQVESDSTSKSVEAPQVDTLEGTWEMSDEATITQKVKKVVVLGTAYGTLQMYSHIPAKERVSRKTRGAFNQDVGLGFASKFQLDGALLSEVPTNLMMGNLGSNFKDKLRERGVREISEADSSGVTVDPKHSDTEVQLKAFEGMYPTGPFTISVPLEDGETLQFEVMEQRIELRSLLSVWKTDEYLYAAGGAWPAVPYSGQTSWESVTGSGSGDGADVRVRVNLPFHPEIRSDVISLAESVQ